MEEAEGVIRGELASNGGWFKTGRGYRVKGIEKAP